MPRSALRGVSHAPSPAPAARAAPAARSAGRAGTVSALERGIAVLRCFESHPAPLSHGEIARATGLPKATVTRLVSTLVSLRLVKQQRGSDRFTLGGGILSLAEACLSGMDVREVARPLLAELAAATGTSVYLAVREGLDMVAIEVCRSPSTVLLFKLHVGSRLPMETSSLGRAYLAALAPAERSRLLAELRAAHRTDWPRLAAALEAALGQAQPRGYCLSIGEWHRDVNAVAVPLVGRDGEVMAINCVGPAFSFTADELCEKVAPRLLATARAVAAEIGGSVPETGTESGAPASAGA